MTKYVQIIVLAAMFSFNSNAQFSKSEIANTKTPKLHMHYEAEFTYDSPTDPAAWNTVPEGLNASYTTTNKLHFRTEVPDLDSVRSIWRPTAWKGEKVNIQVLLWSPDTLNQVRIEFEDLFSSSKIKIDKKNIDAQIERYVLSDYPYNASAKDCSAGSPDTAFLLPDRLEHVNSFELPGKTVRPYWLSLQIPQETVHGIYKGTFTIIAGNNRKNMSIEVKVQNQTLPDPENWKYRLDLWQNPSAVASINHIKPWSNLHKKLLKKHLGLYANAGGKYITTYAIYSPWSDASYYKEDAMIEWIHKIDGSWEFDYSIFDQYVELAMDAGINKAITIYTLLPWGNRYRYLSEESGDYVYENWAPDTEAFRQHWHIFLNSLKDHLVKKGWFDKTYLGINENPMDVTMAAINVIKNNSVDWRITYAGNWHDELNGLLDDYSVLYNEEPTIEKLNKRAASNRSTTFYVCCTPDRPNNFIFSPPVEGRWISWYAAAYGYDGFLRWAYDAWPQDPLRDARHVNWPAGDTFLVYPGANSSIRFEKLREGIVDFEKIHILKDKVAVSTNNKAKRLMSKLEAHLDSIAREKEITKGDNSSLLKAHIQIGLDLINELSEILN